jgi:hypothetical protein
VSSRLCSVQTLNIESSKSHGNTELAAEDASSAQRGTSRTDALTASISAWFSNKVSCQGGVVEESNYLRAFSHCFASSLQPFDSTPQP